MSDTKTTPMPPVAATRIQSQAAKTRSNQSFAGRAQSAASKNVRDGGKTTTPSTNGRQ
jgi:hypothetical protein